MTTGGKVVDVQSHIFPAAYADLLVQQPSPYLRTAGGEGVYTLDYLSPTGSPMQRFVVRLADYSCDRKLADMDAAGVTLSVISTNLPTPDFLPPAAALAGARICNDEVAAWVARHPDRFAGLAVLPLPDVAAALDEVERAAAELGLRGIFMPSQLAGGIMLDDPRLEPLYARLAAWGLPIVLHPTVPAWAAPLADYTMIPMLGFMVDTSIAMLRLILGGVLERHPTLQVVHPHAGGVLPYVMGRVEEQTEVKRRGRDHITRPPGDYYRQVYLDLVSPSAQALDFAYHYAGADRLLFASDHPWVSIPLLLETVTACGWPAAAVEQALWRNADRLFRLGLETHNDLETSV